MPRAPRPTAAPPRTRTRSTSVARRRVSHVPTREEVEQVEVAVPVAVTQTPRDHKGALIHAHKQARAKNPRTRVHALQYLAIGAVGALLFAGWWFTLDRNLNTQAVRSTSEGPGVGEIIQTGVNRFQMPSPMEPIPVPVNQAPRTPTAFEQRLQQAQQEAVTTP